MGIMWYLFTFGFLGAVPGCLVGLRAIFRGDRGRWLWLNLLAGVVGGWLGAWLGAVYGIGVIPLWSPFAAIVGAVLLLWIVSLLRKKQRPGISWPARTRTRDF